MIRIDTDLPGCTRARVWVAEHAIVVEHAGLYTVASRNRDLDREQVAEIAAVLTEASRP